GPAEDVTVERRRTLDVVNVEDGVTEFFDLHDRSVPAVTVCRPVQVWRIAGWRTLALAAQHLGGRTSPEDSGMPALTVDDVTSLPRIAAPVADAVQRPVLSV